MSEKYKAYNPSGHYFITLTIVDWVDLFSRKEFRYVIIDSLNYCIDQKGLTIHAWVIMPSHLHMIVSSYNKLSAIVRDFKKFTSKKLIESILVIPESRRSWLLRIFKENAFTIKRNTKFKVWQDGFHPIELTDYKIFDQKLDYIHMNPVVDEIVDHPEEYRFSSAKDYAGMKGLLDIEFI